ncbi:hypothetical protein NQ317_005292 [Molorchus minor]|uniref:PiggyBac transposable element-derived protein domain-containing protein n=1 Tax=Molorchus minor TaxID=1323400 RepID=A0ABQ9JCK5_9CUCU|nr:hypothetical protein NQ317_005292 [Molorchus minor]
MAGKNKRAWSLVELENLHQDEIHGILDEIPSGDESEDSDGEEIQNMDVIFEEENDDAMQVDADNGDIGWESEDDVPLSRLVMDKDIERRDKNYRISTCGLVGMKWMDRRSVLFLGNYQNPAKMGRVPRRKKDGDLDEIAWPQMIIEYNAHMGYVDKFDMLKSLYEVYIVDASFRLSVARGPIGAVVPSKRGRPSNEKSVNKFMKCVTLELR